MTTPNRADFRFRHPLRVRYAEIDGQGVAYNAHYLTWYDIGITEYLRAIGYDYPLGGDPETGCDFHLVKAVVEFRAPILYDEEIDICIRTRRIGRTSIAFDPAIYLTGADDDLRATGEIVWVNTHQQTHKTEPVPGKLIDAIAAFEGYDPRAR